MPKVPHVKTTPTPKNPPVPLSLEYVREMLTWNIKSHKSDCDKFAAEFAADPAHALEWGNNVLRAAAEYNIHLSVNTWLTAAVADGRVTDVPSLIAFLKEISKELHTRAIRQVRYPSSSTSVMCNAMAMANATAALNLHEAIDKLLERKSPQ